MTLMSEETKPRSTIASSMMETKTQMYIKYLTDRIRYFIAFSFLV